MALGVVLVATGLRLWADPWLGDAVPYAVYFGAVMVAAWYGGLGPALVAIFLGFLGAHYFFMHPHGQMAPFQAPPNPWEQVLSGLLFGLVGLVIALLSESLHASRRRAELAQTQLEQGEERYRTVANFTYDWEYWVAPEGTFVYVSPACQRITGYTAEEFLADADLLAAIIHPEDRERVASHVREALALGKPAALEFRICTRDGQVRWIDHACVPVFAEDGRYLGRRVSNRDATTRIEAEQALRESQQRLALVQQIARIGCFDANLSADQVVWSAELEEIFGLARGSFEGTRQAWRALVYPEDVPRLDAFFAEWFPAGPAEQAWEYRFYRADGELRWAAARGRVLRDDQGHAVRLVGATVDITEQRRLESELRQAKEAAEQADRAKDRFLANISHELRTPMNVILGIAELALSEPLSPTVRDYLETGKGSAEALVAILNELLDYSRLSSGEFALETIPFRLRATVEETVRMFRALASEKGLSLECHIAADVPDARQGDPLRLRQALVNLLSNALKFTPQGSVRVRVQHPAGADDPAWLEFRVWDTGIGISPEAQTRIFAPFAQGTCSTARQYGGTGLGLAITQNLITRMCGQIGLESQPGRGSCFYFTVPLALGTEEIPSPQADEEAAPVPLPPLRILLAEDNPGNQKLTRYLLTKHGHTVEIASHGQEAVDMVRQGHFDLVLMDLQMPLLDGLQATARIRVLADPVQAGIPILAMTAHAMAEDLQRCLAAGMDGYVTKPINSVQLFHTIQRLLRPAMSRSGTRENVCGEKEPGVDERPVFRELVVCFCEEAAPLLDGLKAAVRDKNASELRRVLRRFRATLGFLKVPTALEGLERLEQLGQSGQFDGVAEAVATLERQVESLKQKLAAQTNSALA